MEIMKTPVRLLKTCTVLLSLLLLTQSCRVYRSTSLTLEEAVAADRRVRIKTTDNKTLKFSKIVYEEGIYYGIKEKYRGMERIELQPESIQQIRPVNRSVTGVINALGLAFTTLFIATDIALGSWGTGIWD